ncbi:MAG: DUF134 domain-containing protein [Candidatus Bathyarchaeia archaeon]
MWCHRFRHGRRGRLPKPVMLGAQPSISGFIPTPPSGLEPILLDFAEIEAFRLVDFEGLSQEEAARRMGVSRGTVWRLLQRARRKAAQALSEGRAIHIVPGHYENRR